MPEITCLPLKVTDKLRSLYAATRPGRPHRGHAINRYRLYLLGVADALEISSDALHRAVENGDI